jgi:putative flippase GtrA
MPSLSLQLRRIVRFAVVGLTVAGVFMGLNWLFGHWMGKGASYLLAYPPAILLHYLLNKHWTFGCARTDSARQVSEYLVMVLVTFAIQSAVFKWLTATTSLPGWVDAGVSNGAQMVITFLAMQFRVFKPAPAPK